MPILKLKKMALTEISQDDIVQESNISVDYGMNSNLSIPKDSPVLYANAEYLDSSYYFPGSCEAESPVSGSLRSLSPWNESADDTAAVSTGTNNPMDGNGSSISYILSPISFYTAVSSVYYFSS